MITKKIIIFCGKIIYLALAENIKSKMNLDNIQ